MTGAIIRQVDVTADGVVLKVTVNSHTQTNQHAVRAKYQLHAFVSTERRVFTACIEVFKQPLTT